MKPLCIVGEHDTDELVEAIVAHLEALGSVATVRSADVAPPDSSNTDQNDAEAEVLGTATYGLSDDGRWFATGTGDRTVSDLLDELAPDYDYVVLDGFPDADVPTVAVGDCEFEGPVLASLDPTEPAEVDGLVDDIEQIEPYETLESLVARVKESSESVYAGAIATFTGRVRTKEEESDSPTEYLEFQKYEGVAEERMNAISEQLAERDGVYEVLLHHRVGVIEAEEDIVFVVVLAGHRAEAFETVSDGIDRLKEEVPLFKKEATVDGEFWAHECDHAHSHGH